MTPVDIKRLRQYNFKSFNPKSTIFLLAMNIPIYLVKGRNLDLIWIIAEHSLGIARLLNIYDEYTNVHKFGRG